MGSRLLPDTRILQRSEVGVKVSGEKLGHTFSEAKFKMQLPAEGLPFDLASSLGTKARSQNV